MDQIKLLLSLCFVFLVGWLVTFYHATLGICFISLLTIYIINRELKVRNNKIYRLRMYLNQLNSGDYSYEIEAYQEGEIAKLQASLNKTTVAVQELNKSLTQSKHELNQALEDISHQLKTPLSSLLILNELQDQQDPLVVKGHGQLMRLQYLVESFLKLVRIDANILEMSLELVGVEDLVKGAIHIVEPLLVKRNINVICDFEPELHAFIDPNETIESLVNVLNNKSFYANSVIHIKTYSSGIKSFISASDDGLEIDNVEKNHIFERFYSGSVRSPQSVGIGLSIAKEIMLKQEGELYVSAGNQFVFEMNRFN